MDENSLLQARALCCLLDSALARIQADETADEDVKLIASDIREDIHSFREAVFWSELRRNEQTQTAETTTTESLVPPAGCNGHNALLPSLRSSGRVAVTRESSRSTQCWETTNNVLYGGLGGIGVVGLHHAHHAVTHQMPADIFAHALGELAVAACGGAILAGVISLLSSRLRAPRNFA
jgi:hypothetical protein